MIYSSLCFKKICEKYDDDRDIPFSGSKSKLLVFTPDGRSVDNVVLYVNIERVQLVDSASHLGNIISTCSKDALLVFDMGAGPGGLAAYLHDNRCFKVDSICWESE